MAQGSRIAEQERAPPGSPAMKRDQSSVGTRSMRVDITALGFFAAEAWGRSVHLLPEHPGVAGLDEGCSPLGHQPRHRSRSESTSRSRCSNRSLSSL